MTYKALRNKAYQNSIRLFICEYNGSDWLTNTYIAEENTELPARAKMTTFDTKPKLTVALQNFECNTVLQVIGNKEYQGSEVVELNDSSQTAFRHLQPKFYHYIKARYPSIKLMTDNNFKYAPVYIFDINRDTNQPVAIIMPLTR